MRGVSIFILFITAILSFTLEGYTQEQPFFLNQYTPLSKKDSNKLFLRIENLNFIKNVEYPGDFDKGNTLLGYLITPKLTYYALSNLRIEGGVRLLKYFGFTHFSQTEPIFTLHYQFLPQASIIIGSLNQNYNHNLLTPLFKTEHYFQSKGENGIQVLYAYKQLKFDTWINWEQFIFPNSPIQEKFTFGFSGNYELSPHFSSNKWSIPLQIIGTHTGGETDNNNSSIQTITNATTGIIYQRSIKTHHLKSWGFQGLFLLFREFAPIHKLPFRRGQAFYPSINLKTTNSIINISYWNAYNFLSSKGSLLYQSYNPQMQYLEPHRQLLSGEYTVMKKITKGIKIGGRIGIHYDLYATCVNHSMALYILFDKDFFLKKITR